jgi:hypothetical protein
MAEPKLTPPPELINQWFDSNCTYADNMRQAAQWGADQELEACCEYIAMKGKWFADSHFRLKELRAARRPKPSSLREQALEAMHRNWNPRNSDDFDIIRRALETLPND